MGQSPRTPQADAERPSWTATHRRRSVISPRRSTTKVGSLRLHLTRTRLLTAIDPGNSSPIVRMGVQFVFTTVSKTVGCGASGSDVYEFMLLPSDDSSTEGPNSATFARSRVRFASR
jgi:hypothetical protein